MSTATASQDSNTTSTSTGYFYRSPRRLSRSFEPGQYDVLCIRGKKAHDSEGNCRFRELCKRYHAHYDTCNCKVEKARIVSHIIQTVRGASGCFVKPMVNGEFLDVGDQAAKEKCRRTFRDLAKSSASNQAKAKAKARMAQLWNQTPVQPQKPPTLTPMVTMTLPTNTVTEAPAVASVSDNDSASKLAVVTKRRSSVMPPRRSFFANTADLIEERDYTDNNNNNVLGLLRSSIQSMDDIRKSIRASILATSKRDSILDPRASIQLRGSVVAHLLEAFPVEDMDEEEGVVTIEVPTNKRESIMVPLDMKRESIQLRGSVVAHLLESLPEADIMEGYDDGVTPTTTTEVVIPSPPSAATATVSMEDVIMEVNC